MFCNEDGVVYPSQYFFFSPSNMFVQYYYSVLVCGKFQCVQGYQVRRDGKVGTSPLLLYVIDGEFHLQYEGRNYVASKGDVILIDCNKPHWYYSGPICSFIFLHFTGALSEAITNHLITQNQGALFKLDIGIDIYNIMNEMYSKLCFDQPVNDIELSKAAYNCLCLMQSINHIIPIPFSNSSIISDTIYFIRKNINHRLTIKTLADYAHLNPYYFSHLFKRETGHSPIDYVSNTKINYAKTMLKNSLKSIAEIADFLGYSSSASFINAFTSRVGISPSKFRNTEY